MRTSSSNTDIEKSNRHTSVQGVSPKKSKHHIVSEVYRLRILRDLYKTQVRSIYEEQIQTKLQHERQKVHQQAKDATLLIEYDKSILEQLTQQYQATQDVLAETVKNAKHLVAQFQQNRNNQSVNLTETSIKTLLSELKDA